MKIGYARTSTVDQIAGLDAQLRDLKATGADKTFSERVSSKATKRAQLDAAVDYLRDGDVLVVTKLDRLARSVEDFVRINKAIEDKGASLQVLNLNLDTSTPTGKLMLNMIASIAQFERELMLERQREGIATAKSEGKYKGRVPTARRKLDTIRSMKAEGKTIEDITTATGASRSSIFRLLKETNE